MGSQKKKSFSTSRKLSICILKIVETIYSSNKNLTQKREEKYNHVKKVENAQKGLVKNIERTQARLSHPEVSVALLPPAY